jgi:hypothetical protein
MEKIAAVMASRAARGAPLGDAKNALGANSLSGNM